jgi:hypothetical protein
MYNKEEEKGDVPPATVVILPFLISLILALSQSEIAKHK